MGGRRPTGMATRLAAACLAILSAWHVAPHDVAEWTGIVARAETVAPHVGDLLRPGAFHLISNPGRYGLGPEPAGSRYALIAGLLVRIDMKSLKILSIIRQQREILD